MLGHVLPHDLARHPLRKARRVGGQNGTSERQQDERYGDGEAGHMKP